MAFVSLNEVLIPAYRDEYAIPAFNFWTVEDVQAIIRGAEEENSPVILMSSMSCLNHLGEELAAQIVHALAVKAKVPVVLHLDHAEDVDVILRAMKHGYSSVMYDGSKLPVEENISNTKFVVRAAKAFGIAVEAEIGRVGKGEEGEVATQVLSEPDTALAFFERTKVDALAIAAGTCHGMQKQEAALRFDIIETISKLVQIPLVLHGSSGVKNEDLVRVSRTGITKINFGTRLRTAFVERCRGILDANPGMKNHLTLIEESSEAITATVREKIKYLGSQGKA